ncbi:Histidyl-tRNA synthetase [Aureococcus anophagefferens]|uniref:histidine--tRNA ligase n=1 Tax=Aureococcus anophagefferens TaxID=44056 RepID=A0ABR1FND3_AURAN
MGIDKAPAGGPPVNVRLPAEERIAGIAERKSHHDMKKMPEDPVLQKVLKGLEEMQEKIKAEGATEANVEAGLQQIAKGVDAVLESMPDDDDEETAPARARRPAARARAAAVARAARTAPMGRGGPEIPLEADEVAAWASLTVANPKGEPSAEEREQLKAAKAAEKKGKDAVLEGATGEVRATLPLKWFSIPQCWRFETTQRGRKREHYQWNMDIVGERGVTAEAELLAAVARFFSRLGVTSEMVGVRVNSRKVLDVAITKAGVPGDKFARVCVVIDKLDKIGACAVKEMLTDTSGDDPLALPPATADVILACLEAKSVADLATTVGLPMTDPAIAEIAQLFELADSYGVGDYLQFDSSVVRGLAYYTGVVFEAFDRKGELRAICGGGRYDKLLELYGGEKCDIPCAGFGFGDCVIVELLKENGLLPKLGPSVDVVVAPFSAAMQGPAAAVAAKLRSAGLTVDAALQACKARKAFDLANRAGARLVAFVAPDEWDVGKVRVKDMLVKDPASDPADGVQVDVAVDHLGDLVAVLEAEARAKGAAWVPVGRSSSSASPAPAKPPAGAVLADGGNGVTLKATAKFAALAL